MFQTDTKGLPVFVMNQVLKRQTLSVHHIRRQLISPEQARRQDSSDDEENGQTITGNTKRKDSSKVESFEESVPTSQFTDANY